MTSSAKMERLGIVLVLLASSAACNHLAIQATSVAALPQVGEASDRPGSGITRYPVRIREIRD